MSADLKIKQQTAAEQDDYLIECFEESYFLKDLIDNNYSIIVGRKGTGKTAIARYMEQRYGKYDLALSKRISITDIDRYISNNESDLVERSVFFIIVVTIKTLLENNLLSGEGVTFWTDFLTQNGLLKINDYQTFFEWSKTNELEMGIKIPQIASGGGNYEKTYERTKISLATSYLFNELTSSIESPGKVIIFIDDISDYLDKNNSEELMKYIDIVRDILLILDRQNSNMRDQSMPLSYVACVRDDLFEHMSGSNINKLENSCLKLNWNEETFCKLLIRRLPFYEKDLEDHLANPIKSIVRIFPNEIFKGGASEYLMKQYASNFYAYIMSISFNRPRDFLKYCYCLKSRLSLNGIDFDQLEAAETEYSDYLIKELRDELKITSLLRGFGSNIESIKELVHKLSHTDRFNYGQLRTDMAQYLKVKKASHNNVTDFIKDLWWYGLLGYKNNQKDEHVYFKYIHTIGTYLSESELSNYTYYLHQGIKWAVKRNTHFGGKNVDEDEIV